MSFVSYAQNFEDIMLWRALKHVENGFYIDVGANDPSIESVTKAFYERGWHGINIEPLPSHYADLLHDRPRDINLQCAAGASNGEIEVWECDVRGWATASADVVAQHMATGHEGAFHKVPVTKLSDICAEHVSGEIHFLKIDVEGFEKPVIEGADFLRFRPWILVVEATRPNSTEEIYDEWESIVLAAEYVLAYTDGLNRFYIAKEHRYLLDSLHYPPNVFDGFIRSEQLNSELRAQQAETKAQQAETKAQQAETKAQQAETKAQQADVLASELRAIYASTSWRVTRPLRAIKRILGGDFSTFQRSIAAVIPKSNQEIRPPVSGNCLFVDVSDIVVGDKRTGIQRVVRNILACLISNPPDGYSVYPVYALPIEQGYALAKFELNGVAISVHPEPKLQQIKFIDGDIFLGLDFACGQVIQSKPLLNRLSSIGVKVYFVLYDILPVRMPDYFPNDVYRWHAKWLRDIAEFDGVIAISAAVSIDYAEWLNESKLEKLHCKISHFHLGADIEVSEENSEPLSMKQDEILRLFANRVTFLMVGTIEPRKGQEQVLSAFELLWQQQVDVALVIVGKEGWKTEALINRIRKNKYLNINLFWLSGIEDVFLKKIYETSKCLIAASMGEGFGLPLIEAAQHKIPIIARDIPVFREVAGGSAYYFSGSDHHGMASDIRRWLELYAEDKHPKSNAIQWLTWRKSTDELMKVILDKI